MKKSMLMTFQKVIKKRLERKKTQLQEIELVIEKEMPATAVDKRKFIELKAVVNELENCIDIADSLIDAEED